MISILEKYEKIQAFYLILKSAVVGKETLKQISRYQNNAFVFLTQFRRIWE